MPHQIHCMEIHIVADSHLGSHIEEDGNHTIFQMTKRPDAAFLRISGIIRRSCLSFRFHILSLLSRTLNVWKIRLGSAPCCKGNDEHHYQEWNGELVGRNTIQGHTCKHHARYEERSDGSTERIHRTGEVHALHRLGSRQRIGSNVRIDHHLKHCR